MRDYQPKKHNPYWLRRGLYHRILWLVKDYDEIREQWESLLEESPMMFDEEDGVRIYQPHGNKTGDRTADIAIRRAKLFEELQAVDRAIEEIEPFYRQGILNHIRRGDWFNTTNGASLRTWYRKQAEFLFRVASNLGNI